MSDSPVGTTPHHTRPQSANLRSGMRPSSATPANSTAAKHSTSIRFAGNTSSRPVAGGMSAESPAQERLRLLQGKLENQNSRVSENKFGKEKEKEKPEPQPVTIIKLRTTTGSLQA